LIIDSKKNEERLQQCDLGQENISKPKKSSLTFNLHSTKQQLGERTLSLVNVLRRRFGDDNGLETLLNWNRLVRKKN
jgi:hypothetical protein